MVRCAVAFFAALIALQNIHAAEPAPKPATPENLPALQQRIEEIVSQSRYSAGFWGVKIASLDTGKVIYATNEHKLFSPASNSKLYTMALALDKFGADYRIKTSLYAASRPAADGTLNGNLIIYGRGDPTIINADPHKALAPLVAALTNAGVKKITGDVIGEDSFFRGAPFGSGWCWDDSEYYYGAEVSALTINSNLIQLTIKPGETVGAPARLAFSPTLPYVTAVNRAHTVAKGGQYNIDLYRPVGENVVYVSGTIPMEHPMATEDVTMHDPAGLFAALFKETLAEHGIEVGGRARSVHWIDRAPAPLQVSKLVELGSVESRPLRDIIRAVEKPSQNLYTDMVLDHLGATASPNDAGVSGEDAGIHQLNRFLEKVGVKRGQTIFQDGSGLSRDNLTSPDATVALLTYMSRRKDADVYISALPVAGVDGTLRHRMKGTAAQGNVKAKTGSLEWAHTMSGYVTSAAGERLVFSLMLNRYSGPNKTADLDAITELLANFPVRTDKAAE